MPDFLEGKGEDEQGDVLDDEEEIEAGLLAELDDDEDAAAQDASETQRWAWLGHLRHRHAQHRLPCRPQESRPSFQRHQGLGMTSVSAQRLTLRNPCPVAEAAPPGERGDVDQVPQAREPASQQQQQQQQQAAVTEQPLPLTAEGYVDMDRLTAQQRQKVTK